MHMDTWELLFKATLRERPPVQCHCLFQLLGLAQGTSSWGETADLSTQDSRVEEKHNAALGMKSFALR